MPVFAASLESLIAFVVILLLSALGNWLKQRKGQPEEALGDEDGSPPPVRPLRRESPSPASERPLERPQTPPPQPALDWEKELRRLFGEPETPAPAPPPPVVIAREVPPPPVAQRRAPEPVLRPMPLPAGTHFPRGGEDLDQQEAPSFELATLTESASAHERAVNLDKAAQGRLDAARARTEAPRAALAVRSSRSATPELQAVLDALRQPRTARQAILATVILGPPKALES